MQDRFSKVGIQRQLYLEWFDTAALLHGAGLSKGEARQAIYHYLDSAPGFAATPTEQSKKYIANALIKSWVAPEKPLVALRDAAFKLLKDHPDARIPIHWCLLGAAYPFWFEVAAKIGRLLNLQDQVTQTQVVLRLKEIHGDRQTISRRARYVIRSYVTWGVLKDSAVTGCYEKVAPIIIENHHLAVFMLEAALLAKREGRGVLGSLMNYPAFFPFQLPGMSGDFVARRSDHIEVVRYGLDDELLSLRGSFSGQGQNHAGK